jgi:type IV fimbrial biogenesis protein FimT
MKNLTDSPSLSAHPPQHFVAHFHTKGFTFLELLIVLVIVMITAGLGLPSFSQILDETRAHLYMKSLSRDIAFTRSFAISQGHPVTLCPLDGGVCIDDWTENISIFVDYNLNRKLGGKDVLLKQLQDPAKRDTFIYPRTGITFRSDGSINGFQSGTFRYCPTTKTSEFSTGLVVNQAGRSRFRDEDIQCIK